MRGLLNKGETNNKLEENLKFGVREEPSEDTSMMGQVLLKRSNEGQLRTDWSHSNGEIMNGRLNSNGGAMVNKNRSLSMEESRGVEKETIMSVDKDFEDYLLIARESGECLDRSEKRF